MGGDLVGQCCFDCVDDFGGVWFLFWMEVQYVVVGQDQEFFEVLFYMIGFVCCIWCFFQCFVQFSGVFFVDFDFVVYWE